MRFFTLPLLAAVLFLSGGCAWMPHHKRPSAPPTGSDAPDASPTPAPHRKWHLFPRFPFRIPFLHHQPPPPRAQALTRVGIIRTVGHDGSFVIIELEPGVMIPPGRELLVLPAEGAPIHLRAAENQPPYFIADVESGQPTPGQIVQQ